MHFWPSRGGGRERQPIAAAARAELFEGWYVDPLSLKVVSDRRRPFPSSAKTVDLAAQRGECERAQVWGWNDAV
eukprot:SAG31_NODE_47247_length_251_cov_0.677632_1_plen_73_part_10